MPPNLLRGVALISFITPLFSSAAPRPPQPPLPELVRASFSERFDAAYHAGNRASAVTVQAGLTLVESWSGYALERRGTVTPLLIDGVQNGYTNLFPVGAVRLWFKPDWTSTTLSKGGGPGQVATLAELSVVSGSQTAPVWALQISADGSVLYLASAGEKESTVLLATPLAWTAGQWHQVLLNYTAQGTALIVDGEVVAEGTGVISIPPHVSVLAVGSSLVGTESVAGEVEEVYCFTRPLQTAYHYIPYKDVAALGPISAAELAYRAELAEKWQAAKAQKAAAEAESGGSMMLRLSGPSVECVTNGPVYLTNVLCQLTTNDGWTVYFDIQGGTNEVEYDIFATPDLTGPDITNSVWTWLESGSACETHYFTNQAPNQMFYLLTVPGADRDGDGLYDGWEWKHFGTLAQTADGDYDGDGETNGDAYTNGYNPNQLSFTVEVTNHYIRSTTVPVTVKVMTGFPEAITVLVNETNLAAANWSAFNSSLVVDLPLVEGWHEVRVGLRGHYQDNIVWQTTTLKYDVTAPLLVITSPATLTGARALLQIQGYGTEPLAAVRFDLTNAAKILTNQTGLVNFQSYETNSLEFVTNYFQCFDMWLTNGINDFAVRIVDLAGNQSSTNFTFTLDGSSGTNPPFLNLLWPPPGGLLSGNAFSANGFVDDPATTITVTLIATNGATNIDMGIVGRSGEFWVDDLPLGGGTNQLTLVARDFWGNETATNLMVIRAGLDLTVDSLAAAQMEGFYATITGTINTPGQDVWVNGVQAVVSNGTWQTEGVPLAHQKTLAIHALAVPAGNDPNTTPSTAELRAVQETPPQVEVISYHENLSTEGYTGGGFQVYYVVGSRHVDWAEGRGGEFTSHLRRELVGFGLVDDCTATATLPNTIWDANQAIPAQNSCLGATTIGLPLIAEHEIISTAIDSGRIDAQTALKSNGRDVPGNLNTYLVKLQVQSQYGPIAPETVLVQGQKLTPNAADPTAGELLVQAPSGTERSLTPQTTTPGNFSWSSTVETLQLRVFIGTNDVTGKTNTVVVGQKIGISSALNSFWWNQALTNFQWDVPGSVISTFFVSPDSDRTNGYPVSLTETNSRNVQFHWYNGGTNLEIKCSAAIVTNGITYQFEGKTYFNVLRPDAEFIGEIDGLVSVDTNFKQSANALHFGYYQFATRFTDTNRGMIFRLNSIQTNGFPVGGTFFRFQIADVYGRVNFFGTNQGAVSEAHGLDSTYPAYPYNLANLPDISGDSPGTITTGTWKVARQDHFICYLFYQPDSGIFPTSVPVPIRAIEWTWNGLAVTNGTGWELLSSPSDATILLNNFQVNEYPAWTNNVIIQLQPIVQTNWF